MESPSRKDGTEKSGEPTPQGGTGKSGEPTPQGGTGKNTPRREKTAGKFLERGVLCVAIKSVFRSVHVKDHGRAERLARALENAEGKASVAAAKGRPFSDVDRAEIRKMFGKKA